MAVRRNDVRWFSDCLWDPNSKKTRQKQLGTGPCFFSANVWRTNSIKASFAPTSLQSCKFMHNCLLAPDAPSGNRADSEDMWSFQMLDTEAGQRAHPEGYSSSFGSSRFQASTAGSQRVPREAYSKYYCSSQVFSICWDSEKDLLEVFSICCPARQVFLRLLRFWKTRGGRASNWFRAMLRVRRLSKLSKMCSSRVIKLVLDRSRWSRCFNPFKAPGNNEVNLFVPQEKPSKHHKAIESSVQSAQHVPLQPECYSSTSMSTIVTE